ncbi:uncharacterized protein LOC143211514 isoform X1 [Lasioglossum baleicum]|uniref:uncharacterized protein LOC143211514 isoform X1 n=1 Tax=Lasioglossum baleicum TaxID=434251 RepID=UPI003FCC911C
MFGSLFNSKKSKIDEPTNTEETSEVTKDPLPPLEQTESPKISKTNAVFPFHDVKATSFPPPLSIDASVYTEAEKPIPEEPEIFKEPPAISKNVNNAREDTHTIEKKELEFCDRKTCPKDGLCLDSCEKLSRKQHQTKDKTSTDRLTEMINVSIKEAIETITKRSRMDDAEKHAEKKPKEELAKSVCHSRDSSWKAKRERPRSVEEYFRKCSQKTSRTREKRKRARTCPRKMEELAKCHCKKVVPCEGARSKKRAKSSPGKTDNRRMTGNVNIYICSEATENAQVTAATLFGGPTCINA